MAVGSYEQQYFADKAVHSQRSSNTIALEIHIQSLPTTHHTGLTGDKKKTKQINSTNNPKYKEYCILHFRSFILKIMDGIILISQVPIQLKQVLKYPVNLSLHFRTELPRYNAPVLCLRTKVYQLYKCCSYIGTAPHCVDMDYSIKVAFSVYLKSLPKRQKLNQRSH